MEIKQQDLINAKEAFKPQIKPKLKPQIDVELSKLTRKTVLANDPRLLQVIIKYKRQNDIKRQKTGVEFNDNLMQNQKFLKEVKEIYK